MYNSSLRWPPCVSCSLPRPARSAHTGAEASAILCWVAGVCPGAAPSTQVHPEATGGPRSLQGALCVKATGTVIAEVALIAHGGGSLGWAGQMRRWQEHKVSLFFSFLSFFFFFFANRGFKNRVSRKSLQTRFCKDPTRTHKEYAAISVCCCVSFRVVSTWGEGQGRDMAGAEEWGAWPGLW
jgi:hypothetical protein